MVCRSAVRTLLQRSFAVRLNRSRLCWRGSRAALRRAIRRTRLRRSSGPKDGTSPSRTWFCRCPSRWRSRPTATWNTPTRSCPRISLKINGYRWPRSIPPARSMCIMPWSIFGRRIRNGCGTRRSDVPFTASTLSDPQERLEAHGTTSDLLLVYAPGSSPDRWPDGMAKFVPAGSDLVFQIHYTTNGTAGNDQTSIGLVFAKGATAAARHHSATQRSRIHHSARRG